MSSNGSAPVHFDPGAVHAKYLAERDKRLVEGRADIRELDHDEVFGHYRDDPFTPFIERPPVADEVDVVVVGAGMAGILAGTELRKRGIERIRMIDEAGGVGGTWYWNRYPGIMCDVESYIYIPMLEEFGYMPTHRYASGGEILAHLERIAEKYRLTDDALFHTGVTRAEWHEDEARWHVHTDRGDDIACRWYVLAAGILNLMKLPDIAGMEDFAGHAFHTARWDYGYTGGAADEPLDKLGDKVVALLGTGASGHSGRARPWPSRSSTSTSSSARRRPSVSAGTVPPRTTSAGTSRRGGRRRGWTTSRPSCSAAPSTTTTSTTAGRTTTPSSTIPST